MITKLIDFLKLIIPVIMPFLKIWFKKQEERTEKEKEIMKKAKESFNEPDKDKSAILLNSAINDINRL